LALLAPSKVTVGATLPTPATTELMLLLAPSESLS